MYVANCLPQRCKGVQQKGRGPGIVTHRDRKQSSGHRRAGGGAGDGSYCLMGIDSVCEDERPRRWVVVTAARACEVLKATEAHA